MTGALFEGYCLCQFQYLQYHLLYVDAGGHGGRVVTL